MSQFWNRRKLWTGIVAAACATASSTSVAAQTTSVPTAPVQTAPVQTAPLSSTRSVTNGSVTNGNAVISPRANAPKANAMWATYKGDAQRTGAVDMPIRLPLSLMWRYSSDAEPGAILGSPIAVGSGNARRVLFNAGKMLYCLDAQTGAEIWKWTADANLRAPLTLLVGTNNAVLALSLKGTAQALRVNDGAPVWKYKADSALKVAPVAIRTSRGERIVLAPASGVLVALTMTGVLDTSWRVALGPNGAAPAVALSVNTTGDRLFVAADDGNLYGVDIQSARVAYGVNLGIGATTAPIAMGDMVVGAGGGVLMAARTDNGTVLWRSAVDNENLTSLSAQPPTRTNAGAIYGGTNRGSLAAFNSSDGKMLWKTRLGRTSISGSPLILPTTILVGGRDGVLYGVNRRNGALLWRYRMESERRVLVAKRISTVTGTSGNPTAPVNPYATPFIAGAKPGGTPTATPTPMVYETRNYGTSAAPAALGGKIYVPADNAALFAFSTASFDAAEPLVNEATIVIPDTTNAPYPLNITPTFPGIANKGPVSMTLQLSDAGSGVDASRITVNYDGQPLSSTDAKFDAATGILSLSLFKPTSAAPTLSDGTHTVNVEVADYTGNIARASTSFKVDATYVSPPPRTTGATTAPVAQPSWGGWRGGGWDPTQGPPPWARDRFRDRGSS